jgi:hypothetical protein
MHPEPFELLPDDWIDDLAAVINAAERESEGVSAELAAALCREFKRRDRLMPMAYTRQRVPVDGWRA